MYIVTGGAGFIGSNIVQGLNRRAITDILVVDNLQNSSKFLNLKDYQIADYIDKDAFLALLVHNRLDLKVDVVFHQGACTNTLEDNGKYMMNNNYMYSKTLLHFALSRKVPFIYASSAAVYGHSSSFTEDAKNESPANIYAYSKLLFDQYVRRVFSTAESAIVGLRYFNVYGPNETHKGHMASVIYQFYQQLKSNNTIKLFEGTGGYNDGEQRRDFIFVEDVVRVNLFFGDGAPRKGIVNVGTGEGRSFNEVAQELIALEGSGEIIYTSPPEYLRGKYQSYTEADTSALRQLGYSDPFTSLKAGITSYYAYLEQYPLSRA